MHDAFASLAIFGGVALVALLSVAAWRILTVVPPPDQEALDEQHRSAMPYDSMYVSAADRAPRKSESTADCESEKSFKVVQELSELRYLATQPVPK